MLDSSTLSKFFLNYLLYDNLYLNKPIITQSPSTVFVDAQHTKVVPIILNAGRQWKKADRDVHTHTTKINEIIFSHSIYRKERNSRASNGPVVNGRCGHL